MSKARRDPQDKAFDILTDGGAIPSAALWTPEARITPTEGGSLLEELALYPRVVLDPKLAISAILARGGEQQEASGP